MSGSIGPTVSSYPTPPDSDEGFNSFLSTYTSQYAGILPKPSEYSTPNPVNGLLPIFTLSNPFHPS